MQIILSRKGFDSQYGGQPSPILPDGTLLSFPIPAEGESIGYKDLQHKNKSYFEIIKELNPKTSIKNNYTCHLDPDLRKDCAIRGANWKPLFGQAGSSQGHLKNKGVTQGDVFLFFGTFRHTETHDNQLRYIKTAPEIHVIYAYLQVGEVHDKFDLSTERFNYHPHAGRRFSKEKNNCIYEASEKLSFIDGLNGSGVFSFHKDLVLTKDGFSKSRWYLPDFFKELDISYHSQNSFKANFFQSASKGQEFVFAVNNKTLVWLKNIIKHGMGVSG